MAFFFPSDPFCFQRLLFSLSNEIFLAGLSRLKYQQIYQFKFKKLPLMFTRYKQDKKKCSIFNIHYETHKNLKLSVFLIYKLDKCLYIYIYILEDTTWNYVSHVHHFALIQFFSFGVIECMYYTWSDKYNTRDYLIW